MKWFILLINLLILSARLVKADEETYYDQCIEDLGVAGQFNLFLFNDLDQQYVDVEGRVAVGGSATLEGFGVGAKLDASFKTTDNFIVQGSSLDWTNGQLFMGNLLVSSGTNVHLTSVGIPNGIKKVGSFDFNGPKSYLQTKSQQYYVMMKTADPVNSYGQYYLNANETGINVFQLTQSDIQQMNALYIIGNPLLTGVVINVIGTTIHFGSFGIFLTNVQSSQILWNYRTATSIYFDGGIQLEGTTLAPFATVYGKTGNYKGSLIAKSLSGNDCASQFQGLLCSLCFSKNPKPCTPPTPTPAPPTKTSCPHCPTKTPTPTPTKTPTKTPTPTPTPTPTKPCKNYPHCPTTKTPTPTPTPTRTPTKCRNPHGVYYDC